MGCGSSKAEKDGPLLLCKERRRFIKQAIYSRYNLAAAHKSYIQSLLSVGVALRRFAEAEVLVDSSLSITDLDKTSSPSSSRSPSPSHTVDVSDSPPPPPPRNGSPLSSSALPVSTVSYMRSSGNAAVTVIVNPSSDGFVDADSMGFSMPPPPPPPPDSGSSWDFFDPAGADEGDSFRFAGHGDGDVNFDDVRGWGQFKAEEAGFNGQKASILSAPPLALNNGSKILDKVSSGTSLSGNAAMAQSNSEQESNAAEKELSAEREDPSEFITHRAKDFLSSIKDIEHRFCRASEAGRDVFRLLEANKIRVGYSEVKGRSSESYCLTVFRMVCCNGKTALVSHEPPHHLTKVITWKRSSSLQSSSSKNPLGTASKDDISESGSDLVDESCMLAGSHSSSLDRLYAWERKLYDEVKASQSIRKAYDRKRDQLRHQCAKDLSSHVIDKTRSVVKDLHSQIRVAIYAVDSISKRIECMRDEELLPQLLELIQGLMKMWKDMLACHHEQYITISLAYHARSSTQNPQGDAQWQAIAQLQQEIDCFGLSFADWIKSHTSYVDALNAWLQNCILQPQCQSRSRRPFSPCRALAPPIFVLCRDWLRGIKTLPSDELSEAIKSFALDLHQAIEEHQKKRKQLDSMNGESENKDDEKSNDNSSSNVSFIRSGLTKLLDRLTKFSEASLKAYEDVKRKHEAAQRAYSNGSRASSATF